MTDKDVVKTHPSFGSVRMSNVSGRTNLFGSLIDTGHCIRIEVMEGSMREDHNGLPEYADNGKTVLTFEMSELQWARFISSPGKGIGTPCTLIRRDGKRVEGNPYVDKRLIENSFDTIKEKASGITEKVDSVLSDVEAALNGGATTKKALREIAEKLHDARRDLSERLPWMTATLDEHIQKSVEDGKAAVDQHFKRVQDHVQHEIERSVSGSQAHNIANFLRGDGLIEG